MARPITIEIKKDVTMDELDKRIRSLEKNVRVLKRLYFVKYRYQGYTVKNASEMVDVTEAIGYEWQRRWNEDGYDGLIPRFGGGRPSKLTSEQKEELKKELKGKNWTTEEVREFIFLKFEVEYTLKQIRVILKKFGMNHAKPYPHDYRKPKNAEDILKKTK
jgi:Transposase and inactivated derivatives